jgi:hypothetical protein
VISAFGIDFSPFIQICLQGYHLNKPWEKPRKTEVADLLF